jgi:hypothetical protein
MNQIQPREIKNQCTARVSQFQVRMKRELSYNIAGLCVALRNQLTPDVISFLLKMYLQIDENVFVHLSRWRGFPFLYREEKHIELCSDCNDTQCKNTRYPTEPLRIRTRFSNGRIVGIFCKKTTLQKKRRNEMVCHLNYCVVSHE